MGSALDHLALLNRAAAQLGDVAAMREERAAALVGLEPGPLAHRARSMHARLERRLDAALLRLGQLRQANEPDESSVYGLAERAENIHAHAGRCARAVALLAPGGIDPRVWELEAADVMEAPARVAALLDAAEAARRAAAVAVVAEVSRLRDDVARQAPAAQSGAMERLAAVQLLAGAQRELDGVLRRLGSEVLARSLGMGLPKDPERQGLWYLGQELARVQALIPPAATAALALTAGSAQDQLLTTRALQAWWEEVNEVWIRTEVRLAVASERPQEAVNKIERTRGPLAAAEVERRLASQRLRAETYWPTSGLTRRSVLRKRAHSDAAARRSPYLVRRRWVFGAFLGTGVLSMAGCVALAAIGWLPASALLVLCTLIAMPLLWDRFSLPARPGKRAWRRKQRRELRGLRARLSAAMLDEDSTALDAVVVAADRAAGAARPAAPAADRPVVSSGPHPAAPVSPAAALPEAESLRSVAVRAWRELDRCQSAPRAVQRTEAFGDRVTALSRVVEAIERRDQALAQSAAARLALEEPAGGSAG